MAGSGARWSVAGAAERLIRGPLQVRLVPGQGEAKTGDAQLDGLAPSVSRLIESLGYEPVPSYRAKVAALQEALAGEDAGAACEQIRALIDEIRLVPCPADAKAPLRIEVRGALAGMLALGSGTDASAGEQLAKPFKLVAGAGFEPAAFRL